MGNAVGAIQQLVVRLESLCDAVADAAAPPEAPRRRTPAEIEALLAEPVATEVPSASLAADGSPVDTGATATATDPVGAVLLDVNTRNAISMMKGLSAARDAPRAVTVLKLCALAVGAGTTDAGGINASLAALQMDGAAMGRAKDAGAAAATDAGTANAHDAGSNGIVDGGATSGVAVPNGVAAAMRPAAAKAAAETRAASGGVRSDRTDAVSAAEAATASALSGIKAWGKPRPSPSAAVNIR